MDTTGAVVASTTGMTLLERAINYTLGSLRLVSIEALGRPTPCRDWDLYALLAHLDDSMLALADAVETGQVTLERADPHDTGDPVGTGQATLDPVERLRARARRLLHAVAAARQPESVMVADARLSGVLLTGAGAIEVAVHGWDVAQACGGHHPVPPALADDLLDLAPILVTGTERPGRFGRPRVPPAGAGPAERLLAFLGRDPVS